MSKEEKYADLLAQAKALCEGESDMIAKMANISALLHREMGFWWTGFYRVLHEERDARNGEAREQADNSPLPAPHPSLTLGPFQGPVACTRIAYGRGVCGTAWKERRTVVVPDVEQFPGHIACSSESRSEIVVPVFAHANNQATEHPDNQQVIAVLDIDSRDLAAFDEVDARWLEQICRLLPLR